MTADGPTQSVNISAGWYNNGFLAAGLFWALPQPEASFAFELKVFFLVCVIVAAIYGAWSVRPRILLIQGGPAIAALVFVLLAS